MSVTAFYVALGATPVPLPHSLPPPPPPVVALAPTTHPVAPPVVKPMVAASKQKEPSGGYIENERKYLPVLSKEIDNHWPTVSIRSVFGAQVMQETCPSLRSKKCWSPTAELKTEREYGFGLGQLTVTPRFNNFKEASKLHPSLKDWTWENRYAAEYQLRTMILMDKFSHDKAAWAKTNEDQLAFAFASYNGGLGGVLSDRTVCKVTPGCDPDRWFGHVEKTSKKAKVAVGGYGKSFFEINREYVKNILFVRRPRYEFFFGE